jgi:3-methyladenine DNA glycosylase AlkD
MNTTVPEILTELQGLGKESYRKTMLRHGACEPLYGVAIEDLKKIQKRLGTNHALALQLFDTGVSEAMYLAGLLVEDDCMTREDLQRWAAATSVPLHSECTVAWTAAESRYGRELALQWIDSPEENIADAGWATLSSLVAITPDEDLNLLEIEALLLRVQQTIAHASNRIRSVMNGFVIAVGTYVPPCTEQALRIGEAIGPVPVDKGDTACRIPFAPESIRKAQERGILGKKRKTARC